MRKILYVIHAHPQLVPSVVDRIRQSMASLKMPHAIEILYPTVRRLERVEVTALGASTSCSPKSSCENRRVKVSFYCLLLVMA